VRFVKISQSEIGSILKLYEGVMSYACHGMFYREGEALADNLAELCKGGDLLDCARKILIARGWVEDVAFGGEEIRVRGSVEVSEGSEAETCHRLRGILSRLYYIKSKEPIRFVEVECCSTGAQECIFKPEVS
jgi:predicted hydrocarbon binding protein